MLSCVVFTQAIAKYKMCGGVNCVLRYRMFQNIVCGR